MFHFAIGYQFFNKETVFSHFVAKAMTITMALREIVLEGDDILTKKSKSVERFDARLWTLLDDMCETLKNCNGVGLAAVQVGILRRVFLLDLEDGLTEFINPEIILTEGEEEGLEGCLSVPGIYGYANAPLRVVVRAADRHGKLFKKELSGLGARGAMHEYDHLEGRLFRYKVTRYATQEDLEGDSE